MYGVKLWNNANKNLKVCNLLMVFKRMLNKEIYEGYKCK